VNPYILLLDLGISGTKAVLSSIKGAKADNINGLLDAGQSFVDALEAHKNDVITKANLEAQRG
jgi:hypothetical protein